MKPINEPFTLTPRTEESVLRYRSALLDRPEPITFEGFELVRADFARELERENADLKAMLGELTGGTRVILPKTKDHAAAMYRVAYVALEQFNLNPAGCPAEKEG
jgi:hypothetical protein